MQQNILFSLTMDKLSIERRVYTLFDWAEEVGGFQGFILLLIQIVLPYCQVFSLEKYLVSKLFKSQRMAENTHSELADATKAIQRRKKIKPDNELPLVTWLKNKFAEKCKSLKRRKKHL